MHCSILRALKHIYIVTYGKNQIYRLHLMDRAVTDAWKHILSIQMYLNRNVKLKQVVPSTYAILLLSVLDFEKNMVAKAHQFYFKLSENEVTPGQAAVALHVCMGAQQPDRSTHTLPPLSALG